MLLRILAPLKILSAVRHYGTQFVEGFPMSKSSWMMDPTHSRNLLSCSALDLVEILRSSKTSSWIWSIISGLVTVLCRPGRDATLVGKSPRLTWATQLLTVTYNGACSPYISVRMAWIFFEALPWRGKKSLMRTRVSMLFESRASSDILPFSLSNKKRLAIRHMNRLHLPTKIFRPTTSGSMSVKGLFSITVYVAPLLTLIKKRRKWLCIAELQEAFKILRRKFANSVGMAHPDETFLLRIYRRL